MRTGNLWSVAAVWLVLCVQCTSVVAPDLCEDSQQKTENVSFSDDVYPIIANSCALPGCHVGNFPNGNFTSYDDLKIRVDNGELYFRLTSGQMPPAFSEVPALTVCDVRMITTWIAEGARNN
jgi:hypothetical protein